MQLSVLIRQDKEKFRECRVYLVVLGRLYLGTLPRTYNVLSLYTPL